VVDRDRRVGGRAGAGRALGRTRATICPGAACVNEKARRRTLEFSCSSPILRPYSRILADGIDAFDKKFSKPERKFVEPFMALEAERMMSKDEILAAYMSMNYMGTAGGVDLQGFMAASQEYFGASLFELSDPNNPQSLSRAAILAGMVQAPAAYLKFVRNGGKCGESEKVCLNLKKRRDAVLELMHDNLPEKYTSDLIGRAKAEPLGFVFASRRRQERPVEAESRTFIQYALKESNLPAERWRPESLR
jgi:membrane peptidoglycan carboxypeptidase